MRFPTNLKLSLFSAQKVQAENLCALSTYTRRMKMVSFVLLPLCHWKRSSDPVIRNNRGILDPYTQPFPLYTFAFKYKDVSKHKIQSTAGSRVVQSI
jgi:hypothetical protein